MISSFVIAIIAWLMRLLGFVALAFVVLGIWQPRWLFRRLAKRRAVVARLSRASCIIRICSLAIVVLLVYACVIEPRLLVVHTYRMSLVAQPTTWMRIAFLSDPHASWGKESAFYSRVADRVKTLKPDLILIGGDFVDQNPSALSRLASWQRMTAPLGTYFVLGNHDYYSRATTQVQETLSRMGFQELTNRDQSIIKDGKTLSLVGLDDPQYGDPQYSLLDTTTTLPRIVLVHGPDALMSMPRKEVDLVLMGHTHGGQLRLPFIGPVSLLPQRAPQWLDRGLKYWHGMPVVISQGLGEATAPVRFNCPPEIVILKIGI